MSSPLRSRRRVPRPSPYQLAFPPATITRLEHGLTVIVREDHSAPVTSAQAWCRSGSIHEGPWLGAGLSHVLEHMLFKGTASRTGARIDQEIQEAGGYLNAYTSFDRTVFWINVPGSGTTVAIDILADIMQHATIPSEELSKEMNVIRREMDMNQDDPGRHSSRRLFETAYTRSPLRCPIIGYPELFHQLRADDIRDYYRAHYLPSNVFFVVVGDVRTEAVLDQLRAAYRGATARTLESVVLPAEPRQISSRELLEEAPIELGHLHFAWHIPDVRHPDLPALDVLSTLLGTGRSSRLYREVRERRGLAHSVDAWVFSPGLSGLFGMSAVVDADRLRPAQEGMLAEVRRLQTRPVRFAELRKAVQQFLAGTLATRKTMQGQAQDLGSCWLATDDLHFSEEYLKSVQRLTPEDLHRVACAYLTPENQTSYALLPPGARPVPAISVAADTCFPVDLWKLPNGLRVLLKEDHRLPFVECRAVVRGGVLAETAATNGAGWLLSRMLVKGTTQRTAEQLAEQIESVGGNMDTYAGHNSLGVNLEVLRDDLDLGLHLLSDVLLRPSFPTREFEREKTVQIAAIRSQRDQLLKSAALAMRLRLFGPQGYGLDILGTEESVGRSERSQLFDLHQRLFHPQDAVVAVFGDFRVAEVQRLIEKTLSRWKAPAHAIAPPAPDQPPPAAAAGLQRVVEVRDKKKQAVLVLGFPGTTLADPDRFPLEILQEACSDLGSRLFLRVREKLGLAYYVGAQNFVGLAPGYFGFYAGTTPDKAAEVERELLAEARLLAADGLTPEELHRAQAKILGQRKIARQDLGHLAMTMALDELYGLGFAFGDTEDARYEAVTLEDVRRVAGRFLQPDRAVLALTGGANGAANGPAEDSPHAPPA